MRLHLGVRLGRFGIGIHFLQLAERDFGLRLRDAFRPVVFGDDGGLVVFDGVGVGLLRLRGDATGSRSASVRANKLTDMRPSMVILESVRKWCFRFTFSAGMAPRGG